MDENYEDDFEPQFEEVKPLAGGQNSQKVDANNNENSSSQVHRMRISIDIHTIKDQDFRGSVYAKHTSFPQLNIMHFKTSPVVELPNARVEGSFKNSFKSYTFEADKNKLYETLNSTNFEIELWHQDRLTKDIMIGICQVDFATLLKAPLRKTTNSYARVEDAYIPLDEVDEYRKPIKKIGLMRIILYLEDLGPEDLLKEREKQLGIKEGKQQQSRIPDQHVITLPSQKLDQNDDPEKQRVLNEMNSLEYKIIWELETWKKAEEAKFKIQIKQKEMEYLQQLAEQYKVKDQEKMKHFKQAEASILLLERKLRDKASDLNKREQKILMTEDEQRTRIQETARIVSARDDEINNLKKKLREEKGNLEKEKTALTMQLDAQTQKVKQLTAEYESFKKEQANSPVTLVKNELGQKIQEIKELQKELAREHQVKDQYKVYYEKLRGELVKQKKIFEDHKERNNSAQNQDVQELKQQIEELRRQNREKENQIPQYTSHNQQQYRNQQQYSPPQKQQQQNPLKYNNNNQQQLDNVLQEQFSQQSQDYPEYQWDKSDLNELDRLIQERDYLLQTGDYLESDPLIIELNNQIAQFQQ